MDGGRLQLDWHFPVQEKPLVGDFVRYGPRGTGEFMFLSRDGNPFKFMTGWLLEDWEVSDEKAIWHVRPEVYWQGRDVMESRELVAEDIVADLLWFREAPGGVGFKDITTGEIYATDRYTLEIVFSEGYNYMLMYLVGYEDRAVISPPETEASTNWEDMVGTGPFMFEEYVVGSHMTFLRNPNWWQTATIDGVEYELPFVDKAIVPIIPDVATQVAAIRTAKLDWIEYVAPAFWSSLIETAPSLEYRIGAGVAGVVLELLNTQPPLDQVNVRRALFMGTNLDEFVKMMGVPVDLPTFWIPYPTDNPMYRPLEEWPEDVRQLYDYNPTRAKEMLAEAGYPDGFTLELLTLPDPERVDQAELLKSQWAKIGVEVNIDVRDSLTYTSLWYDIAYKDMILSVGITTAETMLMMSRYYRSDAIFARNNYSNPEADVFIDKALAEIDIDEQMRLNDEALLLIMPEADRIPLAPGADGHFWWPWMKNYYGERNATDYTNPWPILAHVWIDQDLKAEMGY